MLPRRVMQAVVVLAALATTVASGFAPRASGGETLVGECVGCSAMTQLHTGCCETGALCDFCCRCDTRWTATADWMWMDRNRADQQSLVIADVNAVLIPILDAGDLSFDVNNGLRTSIQREFDSGRRFELSYLGLIDQTARQTISLSPATPNLNSVTYRFFGATAGNATEYLADYQSDFHSAEANLHEGCWYGFEPFAGFRWLYFGERFDLFEVTTPSSGALGEMRNNLLGAQVGARKQLWGWGRWLRAELLMKGGVFYNQIEMHGDIHTGAGVTAAIDRSFSQSSALGEIQLTAIWQPTPCLKFRAGYTGIWLNDVPMLVDQFDNFNIANGQGNLEDAHIRFHGGHVGFEVNW